VFITTCERAHPSLREQVAGLGGDEDQAVGEGGADPLLDPNQTDQRMARRAVEEGREELREGVVEVEDQRRAPQLRPPGGKDEGVGHVVDLDQVEGLFSVELGHFAGGAGEEAGVAAEVGTGATTRLVRGGTVEGDPTGADRDFLVVVEADAVDPVAAVGEGAGLALDAGVDCEVRVMDHADPQAAAAFDGCWDLSYLP
jgi:hypothetical protein